MHFSSFVASALALATGSLAIEKGFNYGATNADSSCRKYEDFHKMFTRSRNLVGAPGFTSARLYTSIQCGSDNAPIEAIKAALDTSTNLLLGLWASAGQGMIDNEIIAIKQAAANWPANMKARVIGISVGSEDMYRASAEGQVNGSGAGATVKEIRKYIKQVRKALKGTVLEGVPIGHVDTLTGWTVGNNKNAIKSADFLGFNGFPYWENTKPNGVSNGASLFDAGVGALEAVANGKPVWVTETGWPVSGPTNGEAVASPQNAKTYWNDVGCNKLFGKRNTFWYTLYDANADQTSMSFAVVKPADGAGQKFNLKCPA